MNTLPSNIFTNPDLITHKKTKSRYHLMLKDKVILAIDGAEVKVVKRSLLPLALRGKQDLDYADFHRWLDRKVLPFNRENYKKLINNLGLDQGDNFNIALACKALSLTDCYWIRLDHEKHLTWSDVNLYENKFSKSVGYLAFTGHTPVSVTGEFITPELTNLGMFAKCWVREEDGLFLYKANSSSGREAEVEFLVSKLLEGAGVTHVSYELTEYEGKPSVRCRNITSPDNMIVPANELLKFFVDLGKQPLEQVNNFYSQDFNTMLVLDYIINNYDRHTYNWGVHMNPNDGNVLGLHPLFDHNCALDYSELSHNSICYQTKTLREAAVDSLLKLKDTSFLYRLLNYLDSEDCVTLFRVKHKFKKEWSELRYRCVDLINVLTY